MKRNKRTWGIGNFIVEVENMKSEPVTWGAEKNQIVYVWMFLCKIHKFIHIILS